MEENKIPKKIHYVWVGGQEKPKDIKKCMKTWKEHFAGYEIKEWNESNFDINSHPFCKAAYNAKKWAYVSDYIRAYVIYNEGGIYLDTDIILLDNFDDFLKNRAFVGFENVDHPFTAVFGAEKNHPFVKRMLDYYDEIKEYNFDFISNNTISVSDILINEYGAIKNNEYQILKDDIALYEDNVLCNPSENSTSIHIFTGTWLEEKKNIKYKIVKFLKLRLNKKWKAELYRKVFNNK